ncbi:hypothetical protein TYRP_008943 [Tyrophagus putrescentiae]|nr:hypothetical protein TYRP_008943 [Tyrophagus putrescentiae]
MKYSLISAALTTLRRPPSHPRAGHLIAVLISAPAPVGGPITLHLLVVARCRTLGHVGAQKWAFCGGGGQLLLQLKQSHHSPAPRYGLQAVLILVVLQVVELLQRETPIGVGVKVAEHEAHRRLAAMFSG